MTVKMFDGGPDGTVIGANGGLVGFYGQTPVTQRSNPMEHMAGGFPLGTVTTYSANGGAPANANTITTVDVAFTVNGIAANDMIMAVNKPSAQAGMGVCNAWANAANTVTVSLTNPTAANVVPTPNQNWVFAAFRGFNTISANLTAGVVLAGQTKEVEYTLGGTGAAGNATTDASGAVISVTMSNQGSGYVVPPTVQIPGAPVPGQLMSGTFTGLGIDPAPTALNNGQGASGRAIVTANGTISGVEITRGGTGYPVSSTFPISFTGGVVVSPGMAVAVNKMSAANAGVGIGNVRVSGRNKISVQFFNTTAANVTPAANLAYQIAAIHKMMPVSPVAIIQANQANMTVTQANTANAQSLAVPGIVATDVVLGVHPTTANTGGTMNGGICSANAIVAEYMGGGATTWSPAAGVYNYTVLRPTMPQPVKLFQMPFTTTTSIGAANTAEIVVTIPANETLTANMAVVVNKPSHTPYLSVVGCRANDASTIGITFQNLNANAGIIPPAEMYTVAIFPSAVPTVASSAVVGTASYTAFVGLSYNSLMDLANELQATLDSVNLIGGGAL